MKKEAQARIKINKLLEEAGWRIFDDDKGKANIVLEGGITLTEAYMNEFGDDFEGTKKGYIDYLLVDNECFPVALIEAQRQIVARIESEQQLVEASRQLIEMYERKIRERIGKVWGE